MKRIKRKELKRYLLISLKYNKWMKNNLIDLEHYEGATAYEAKEQELYDLAKHFNIDIYS